MIYSSAQEFLDAPNKRILLFGMSGLGKTHVSGILRQTEQWFHYSVDYRIGTRYMGEHIADNFKQMAWEVPFLRDLLLSDTIHISANVHTEDLKAVSTYLGKPGNPVQGGLDFVQYQHRQDQFREAEISALKDTAHFIDRAQRIYHYPHFICDTGGSICEWVDPTDANDPLLVELAQSCLMVWLKGSDAHTAELVRRFDKAPKPMSYQPEFLLTCWREYLNENNCKEGEVNPDAFIRWTYARALAHRQPRYQAMAENFGITVDADLLKNVSTEQDCLTVIASAFPHSG